MGVVFVCGVVGLHCFRQQSEAFYYLACHQKNAVDISFQIVDTSGKCDKELCRTVLCSGSLHLTCTC